MELRENKANDIKEIKTEELSSLTRKHRIRMDLEHDMLKFGSVVLPNMFTLPSPPFHQELCNIFQEKKFRKMNIVAPRNHAKSSIGACVFPLHHLFFDKGKKVIVLTSKTQSHAINLLQTIKDALDFSMPLRTLFGYWGRHSARQWSKDVVILKDGSVIVCKGTGQQIRGLKFGDQRPTLIVLDDPEDENNTKTHTSMEWNLKWMLQTVEPALDAKTGRILIIGTPQHERCMVETIFDMHDWYSLRYKAIINDSKKLVLWKEQFDYDELLAKKKALESINRISVFYREYQCEVIGDEDQLFKEEYLQYYDGHIEVKDDEKFLITDELRIPVNIFTGIDPASSTKQTADYSTIVSVAIDADNNRYVLPYYRKHAKPLDLAESIISNYKKYRADKTRIESVGYQDMLRDYVRSQCDKKNMYIPGLEIKENPRTSKSSRLESMEPYFYQKKMFIMKNMDDLIGELLTYPRGKNDDLLDGLFYAMKGAYAHYEKATPKDGSRGAFVWEKAPEYDSAVL